MLVLSGGAGFPGSGLRSLPEGQVVLLGEEGFLLMESETDPAFASSNISASIGHFLFTIRKITGLYLSLYSSHPTETTAQGPLGRPAERIRAFPGFLCPEKRTAKAGVGRILGKAQGKQRLEN